MVHQSLTRIALAALAAVLLAACEVPPARVAAVAVENTPPPAPREFRAAWVTSVANIDWPSKPGLPVATQKDEMLRIIDRAQRMGLNALVLQVRPAADALYPSALEPWSEYLTGTQGVAPEPFYDPLATWIAECHRRGIELHAWFNPYRARHSSAKSALASSHIANTQPQVVKAYGDFLWMDPGEPEAARRTLEVIADVVRRYDVDGIHIDDYFYPYPVNRPNGGAEVDFPDDNSWRRYVMNGATMSRDDWRRQNVNQLVERMNATVHREKPWVRFGVSPFGIGRPDRRPPGIIGFSQYDKLYADVELWLARGWMDYVVPQLYWAIDSPGQPLGPLLDYWKTQNTAGRHLWPGFFTSRINDTPESWSAEEIANEVALVRRKQATGHVHFSMVALMENRKGVADRLAAAYATPALVPATPWLGETPPGAPDVRVTIPASEPGTILMESTPTTPAQAWLLAVWTRYGEAWNFRIVPATAPSTRIEAKRNGLPLEALVVSSVSRLGVEGSRVFVPLDGLPIAR